MAFRFNWLFLRQHLIDALHESIPRLMPRRADWMVPCADSDVASESSQAEELHRAVEKPIPVGQFPEFQQNCLQSRSRLEELPVVQAWLSNCLTGTTEEQLSNLQLVMAEAFTNAVLHAHQGLDEQTPIELQVIQRHSRIDIEIWDRGQPFDLRAHLTETLNHYASGDRLEEESGRGLLFIHRLVDSIDYRRVGDRNCLLLSKFLQTSGEPPISRST